MESQGPAESQELKIQKGDFIKESKESFRSSYALGVVLGQGAFGEVRKCVHKITKTNRAVKLVKKDTLDGKYLQAFKDEIAILKKLDHPNILKLFEIYEDKQKFYVVTEECNGGELFDQIIEKGTYSERDAANTLQQILHAIAYCHALKICHRDLKPENVLIDKELNNSLKIIDFGAGTLFGSDKLSSQYGTSYYIAPEVLKG